MDHSTQAAASVIASLALGYGIFLLVVVAFTLWVYWRIFEKAGYSGALSLLNLVPGVGPLICMIILAFGRWPIEDRLAAALGGPVSPGSAPAPPGTSVMPSQ
jgi:uncharacterized membrane protein YhaH (DUF805 family)